MSNPKLDRSAFPNPDAPGMTLRDYFAAKAMDAYIAEYFRLNGPSFSTPHLMSNLPAHAYDMADAMLAERDK